MPEADWNQLKSAYGLADSEINSFKSGGYSADQASQLLQLSSGGGGQARGGGNLGGGQGTGATTLPTIGGSGLTPHMLNQLSQIFAPRGSQQPQQQQPQQQPGTTTVDQT